MFFGVLAESMLLSRSAFLQQSYLLPTMTSLFTSSSSSETNAKSGKSKPSTDNGGDAPSLKSYFQLTVDSDGVTSIIKRDFVNTEVKGYSNTPQVIEKMNPEIAIPTDIVFTALSGEDPWHHAPAPQIVVCLGGGWHIKTNDGKRVDFHPGDVLYQDNTENHPGATKGKAVEHAAQHFSGSLNGEQCDQMIVQLELKKGPVVADSTKEVPRPF